MPEWDSKLKNNAMSKKRLQRSKVMMKIGGKIGKGEGKHKKNEKCNLMDLSGWTQEYW